MKSPSPIASLTISRPPKRIKLESRSPTPKDATDNADDRIELVEGDHCSVCLQQLVDRTVIPTCAHEFCFECILVWTEQSRRCPLCSQRINEYLIHHIRSKFDYQKHYLAPLRTSPPPLQPWGRDGGRREGRRRERPLGRRARRDAESNMDEADELERAVARRRWVYDHGLYAKHVASNSFTRYRPYPSPAQFSSSPDLITRMTIFLRRELRVWINLDVEFLTTFTLSLMKSIDIRSEAAVNLLAEFLDMDTGQNAQGGGARRNAEHFAHEVYCYLRSPYRDLSVYDSVVQYDTPVDLPPPVELEQSRRWRVASLRSRSRSGSRSPRSHSRSHYHSRHHSRSRSRSRSSARSDSPQRERHSHRHSHRSPPAPRRRRVDGDGRGPAEREGRTGRYDVRDEYSRAPPRRRIGSSRSPSRDREEERRDQRRSARQRDERADERRKGKGKDRRRVDHTSTPTPAHSCSHSRSPSPISMNATPSEQPASSNVAVMETRKGKHLAGGDVVVDGDVVVMEAERHSHLRTHLRSAVRLPQTQTQSQAEASTDIISRAVDRGNSEMKDGSVPESATHSVNNNIKRLRPSRKLGILQAVQAHLGSNTNPNSSGRQTHDKIDAGLPAKGRVDEDGDKRDVVAVRKGSTWVSEPSSSAEAKPSLLARLSDQRPTPLSGIDTADTPPRPTVHVADAEVPKPRLSGPEIMARTRARLAKLKNEPVAGVLPTPTRSADVINGLDGTDGGRLQTSSNDDIRARLLNRLEEEKRQIVLPEEGSHPAISAADTSRSLKAGLDSQAAEAKLRMQAQVRVRLAAAKRATGDHPPGGAVEEVQMSGRVGEFEREESLRAKLRERRT